MCGRYRRIGMWAKVAVTITALVVFGACANEAPNDAASKPDVTSDPKTSTDDTEDYDGPWKLVEGSGPEGEVPVVKGWDVTGHIDDVWMFGDTGCNYYSLRIKVVGTALSFGRGGYLDEMGCGTPAPENAYLAALYETTDIARDGDRLVLSGPEARLVFEAVAPPPLDSIVGRRWRLTKLISTHPRTRVIPTRGELVLHEDGTFEGSTICTPLRGKWIAEGDRIMFTEFNSPGRRCSGDEAEVSGSVVNALGDGFTAKVDGSKLTIFATRSRDRLVYRAP